MKTLKNLKSYPSAIIGSFIVFLLILLAVYAVVKIPYSEAIRLWQGGEEVWYHNPKNAAPAWFNYFTKNKLPESFSASVGEDGITKVVTPGKSGTSTIEFTYSFDYDYDDYPQELFLYFNSQYKTKQPFVSVYLIAPDGREISIDNFGVSQKQTFRFSQNDRLIKKYQETTVMKGLFSDPSSEELTPLKGTYQLVIKGLVFESDSDIDVEFVFHGVLYGLAGTDHMRRDLMVPLLWGTPIALAFGLAAALGTALLTMIISAIGSWYGGWVDRLIQQITEINMVLPFLAILIMIGTLYSRSIWVILGATILLSIFSGSIKSYRAIFLQVKESTYIEAARAYGASDSRIVFIYLIPRMIPLLIPNLVSSVPSFVFLEASLAILGLGDPVLPTWGKVINDALGFGAVYKGFYYWILEPALLLMITGLGFAMLGFALDRIFNPRLRDI